MLPHIKKTQTILLTYLCITFCIFDGKSQDSDFDSFLRGGPEDASTLLKYFMEPIVVGFSYGMSNSWYNTAKPHESLGFDLTITANLTTVPSSKEFFTFDPSEYNNVTSAGSTDQIPTIMGPEDFSALLVFTYDDENIGQSINGFYSPVGLGIKETIGWNVVPSPMIQLGIGTFKSTDLIIRYVPSLTFGDFTSSVFGLGIKHDYKQWIPGLKEVPIDLSILGAFSGFKNTFDMSDMELEGNDQEAKFNINNWTIQALVSKQISVLTLYGSFGYSDINSSLKLSGTYEIEDAVNPLNTFSLTDPVDLSYEENSFRGTLGLRLKFGFFTLHGDYTFQKYNIASAGIGISFN
jgi:hypothetical protein